MSASERGNDMKHVCTNTFWHWDPMFGRCRKWQESGRRRIVVANFKIDE
jgi:hypothetical protein